MQPHSLTAHPIRLGLTVLMAVLTLAACSPRQLCIDAATRDLRVLTRLIAETEANLQRGYALEEVTETRTRWVICDPGEPATETSPGRPPQRCLDDVDYTVTRPRAINLTEERQKLISMKEKQKQLNRAAAPAVAQCKIEHPE